MIFADLAPGESVFIDANTACRNNRRSYRSFPAFEKPSKQF
jgi:hypothetical protein